MILDNWINSLTLEQAQSELRALHAKYDERGMAMRDTGDVVRSLYVCAKCGKRFLIIGESYCHCPDKVRPRK